jgi:hypothetical protein
MAVCLSTSDNSRTAKDIFMSVILGSFTEIFYIFQFCFMLETCILVSI